MEPVSEIYYGPRDESFVEMIRNVLEKGRLKKKYLDMLLDAESLRLYSQIFTHISADPVKNYEYFETLGDNTANKCIVWYFTRRFPQIFCPEGVKIVSRLKIVYGSKESFYPIAEKLGFWPFISASVETRASKKKSLLEDTFEAFIGATEYLLDERIRVGVGYAIVYDIIANLFDGIEISLAYRDIFDSKTVLKEDFDYFEHGRDGKAPIGKLVYESSRSADGLHTSIAYRVVGIGPTARKIELGRGSANKVKDAEQFAAKQALDRLKREGYSKPEPADYARFCSFRP